MTIKNTHEHTARNLVWLVLGTACAIAALTLLVPKPADPTLDTTGFYAGVMVTSFFAVLHVGAAVLFLYGVRDFKPQLRRAYSIICGGLVCLALALLQFPFFSVLNLWHRAWFSDGGALLPYLAAEVLLFGGVAAFAAILGARGRWFSGGPMTGLLLSAGLLTYALFQLSDGARSSFDVGLPVELVMFLLACAALSLALRIKGAAGPAYTNALAWFVLALSVNIFVFIIGAVANITGAEGPWQGIAPAIQGILFMKAGYAFNKVNSY